MKVLFLTGAGISVSAGLHTYRGDDGLYKNIQETFGLPVERLLSAMTLNNNPELLWAYWHSFLANLDGAQPGICHQTMVELQKICDGFLEVTQNVDGLSRLAGMPETSLVELHGRADTVKCLRCKKETPPPPMSDGVPYCKDCGNTHKGLLRPCVTLFGENLSRKSILQAHEFLASADLFVVTGTTIQFDYLVFLITEAIGQGVPVLYIDPKASPYAGALLSADFDTDLVGGIIPIRLGAELVLPLLLDDLKACKGLDLGRSDLKVRMQALKAQVEMTCA